MEFHFLKEIYKTSIIIRNKSTMHRIIQALRRATANGYLEAIADLDYNIFAIFKGADQRITRKWNVRIYKYSRRNSGFTLVCNDFLTLYHVLNNILEEPDPHKTVIRIDDAGWGFPLGGVMVGATDEKMVVCKVIDVRYFQNSLFASNKFLEEYARQGVALLDAIHAKPDQHRIEICTGTINGLLKQRLRQKGYHVEVTEIKGLLQDKLEMQFGEHIKSLVNCDIYYDPKNMSTPEIAKRFRRALDYGLKHCPHLLKNGWPKIQESLAKNGLSWES
jgi:hypothetical protein